MTLQVILDSRFHGNDRGLSSSDCSKHLVRLTLLLPVLVLLMYAWGPALADSAQQVHNVPDSIANHPELEKQLKSDGAMLEVYKTLLEDQRSINSQFATWFGIGLVLVLFLNGGALFIIVRAGERRYKALLNEASRSIENALTVRINTLIADNDLFIKAVHNTMRGEVYAIQYQQKSEAQAREPESRELLIDAFLSLAAAIDSLVKILGNTPSLKNLYIWILTGIRDCLRVVAVKDMGQQSHVSALRRNLETLKGFTVWKSEHEMLNLVEQVQSLVAGRDTHSSSGDLGREAQDGSGET